MWKLKNLGLLNLDPRLEEIADSIKREFYIGVITQVEKPGMDGRHLDIRCRNRIFGKMIEDWVNIRWVYDPERPSMMCAWHHKANENDPDTHYHLHLQVHPNTRKREES